MKEFLELVRAIAWPAVAAAALYAFYEPLSAFIGDIGKRATKISAFHFEVEFPPLTEAQVTTAQIRELNDAGVMQSNVGTLVDLLKTDSPIDYAVIDLGRGTEWLTSRLFIFALILQRQRGLRCLVLVATSDAGNLKQLVGMTTPSELRWMLATHFPWLEKSFATAYQETLQALLPDEQFILSSSGALTPNLADNLIVSFVQGIQSPKAQTGWIQLESSNVWERAGWLNRSDAESYLRDVLHRSSVEAPPNRPNSEVVDSILKCQGEFVALLDANKRFSGLVDRHAIMEQVIGRR